MNNEAVFSLTPVGAYDNVNTNPSQVIKTEVGQ